MEELQMLVDMVKDLPGMALWLVAFYFFYKVMIVGSVYSVIRLGIAATKETFLKWGTGDRVVKLETNSMGTLFMEEAYIRMPELRDAVNNRKHSAGSYIHDRDMQYIIDAVKEKTEREKDE